MNLRKQAITSLSALILLSMLGMGAGLFYFSRTVTDSTHVIYEHYPAAQNSLELIRDVNQATTLLNDYLLTGNPNFKNEFYYIKDSINNNLKQQRQHVSHNHGSLGTMNIEHLESLINQFFDYSDKLFELRDNDLLNYPGIEMAATLTDPYTLAYLGLVNELIDEDFSDFSLELQSKIQKQLYQLRYSWIQMNNAFRIFMTTRSDNDIQNFYTYSAINGQAHVQLKEMNIELGFDTLNELEALREQRLENVPKVVDVFKSKQWRQDIHLMQTSVYPVINEIKDILQQYSNDLTQKAKEDADSFILDLDRSYVLSGLVVIAILLVMAFVAVVILKGLQPIVKLTEYANKTSKDVTQKIDETMLERKDEVGNLARSFKKLTGDLFSDIRKRKSAESKFVSLLYAAPDATIIVNKKGEIEYVSKQAEVLFDYTADELTGKNIEILIPERYRKNHIANRTSFVDSPANRPMSDGDELKALKKSGEEFPAEISLAPIYTIDGLLISASIRDVSEKIEVRQKLSYQANYDDLTGLPNRMLVMDRLKHAIATAHRQNNLVAILFIDLDNFKTVNDSLGHAVGDKLLVEVAKRLNSCVREGDTVARFGGDEFLVLLENISDIKTVEIIATKIIDNVSQVYEIESRDLYIGASIGITGYPIDGSDAEVLLRNADAAMYQAKYAGKNTFRFFTEHINTQLNRRLEVETQLRSALDNNELYLHYQPMYDIQRRSFVGAEALLRWKNPVLGAVPVEEFIQIAEETGLINSVGQWVLLEACKTAQTWQKITMHPVRLAVNISAVQFRGGDLIGHVRDAIEGSGFDPALLELEITERVLIEDNPNSTQIIHDLKRVGVRLALDDFGTGYSSLSYLKRFPFDVLKIDRSFIQDVMTDQESALLCRAIAAMAHSLNLSVVGEGVETEAQCQFLHELGAYILQGYFFSPAIAAAEFIEFLEEKGDDFEADCDSGGVA